MLYRLRVRVHDLLRRHYRFEQGAVEFYICASRLRPRREPEFAVAWPGLDPVRVTREQFVNLDNRLRAEGVVTLDDLSEEDDDA